MCLRGWVMNGKEVRIGELVFEVVAEEKHVLRGEAVLTGYYLLNGGKVSLVTTRNKRVPR